ncbi:MAG TPA: glycosyltransferase family 4 protein [Verrucomicrobiae bacterium]|nr:glycosyltransferase family 4 protein [Verrucomicrobiae bacterium]
MAKNFVWKSSKHIEPQRIGFVSTRFAGTDGVSLESTKWADALGDDRHESFWYSGRSDRPPDSSMCVPEANFAHPENVWINSRIWGVIRRDPVVSRRIHNVSDYLKLTLREFIERYDIGILVVENALAIPMHVPLGVAIAELLCEMPVAAIGHHHDFYWERQRFGVNAVPDYLDMAFPPRRASLQHVVINEVAQEELSRRKGLPSVLVPNVLDFENPPPPPDAYAADVRAELGLVPGDVFILQPTRVVPRKGIEQAINLVKQLGDSRYKLIVSHESGDEGEEYRQMLVDWAKASGVDLRFVAYRVGDVRQVDNEGRKIFTMWDLYSQADLVTYPSLYEGFGNAFLEAIYFKVPVIVNRYAIFGRDIEPKGFRVPTMDGFVTRRMVAEVHRVLEDAEYRREMVEHNYRVAARYFDYAELRRRLRTVIANIAGGTRINGA